MFISSLIYLFIFFLVFFGTSSLLGMWMLMELVSFTFVVMLFFPFYLSMSKYAISFFLVQSFSGMPILGFMVIFVFSNLELTNIGAFLVLLFFLKLGLFPYYGWYLSIFKGLGWHHVLILCTFFKIIPLLILSYLNLSLWVSLFGAISSFLGVLNGLVYADLKSLVGSSSIVQTGWMLLSISLGLEIWLVYFLIYTFLMFLLCSLFFWMDSFYVWDLLSFKGLDWVLWPVLGFIFSGVPPLSMFLGKFYIVWCSLVGGYLVFMMFLVFSSLLSSFFYIRLVSSVLLGSYSLMKIYYFGNFGYTILVVYLPFVLIFTMGSVLFFN